MRPVLLALALLLAACSDTSQPLPAGSDNFPTSPEVSAAQTQAAPTTCDVVREALLTGTQAEIDASMRALVADKTADVDPRETADQYLREELPETKEALAGLLRTECSMSGPS